MKKSNGGFSLIELIVVIAIMAILAGVSIPTYTAYIGRANDAAALEVLNEVKTAVIADAALQGETVYSINVSEAGEVTASNSTTALTFSEYSDIVESDSAAISTALSKSKSYTSGASWTSDNGWN
ncbi:MAG: prepilin-type N-terminal cleavage/methylation domain-containing protein [Lachnospiraceae bacterium]|nr:prepilin-type N-terminal cleavage/methylation domain-containing protein [Lachnospiraceae bacterium]